MLPVPFLCVSDRYSGQVPSWIFRCDNKVTFAFLCLAAGRAAVRDRSPRSPTPMRLCFTFTRRRWLLYRLCLCWHKSWFYFWFYLPPYPKCVLFFFCWRCCFSSSIMTEATRAEQTCNACMRTHSRGIYVRACPCRRSRARKQSCLCTPYRCFGVYFCLTSFGCPTSRTTPPCACHHALTTCAGPRHCCCKKNSGRDRPALGCIVICMEKTSRKLPGDGERLIDLSSIHRQTHLPPAWVSSYLPFCGAQLVWESGGLHIGTRNDQMPVSSPPPLAPVRVCIRIRHSTAVSPHIFLVFGI